MEKIYDEQGFSLIETLIAVVLIGISFTLLGSFIFQNAQAIKLTQKKEEAIFVREDIKEWLMYRGQTQAIADLNQIVLVKSKDPASLDEEIKIRQSHLILDNTGIQYDEKKNAKYGEKKILWTSESGGFNTKVKYDHEGGLLPSNLAENNDNKFYIGQYHQRDNEETDYLVSVTVTKKSIAADYDPRKDGVDLTILIYDKNTGNLLTETYLNWVVEL